VALAISQWRQSVRVVSKYVAHAAQPAGVVAFAVQPCIDLRAGLVRVVAAAFAFEVATVAAIVTAILTRQAFVTSPRRIRVLSALICSPDQAFVLGMLEHQIEELDESVVFDQALTILVENAGYPHDVVNGQAINQRNRSLYWVCSISWRGLAAAKNLQK
jgi:hypothetical protein